LRQLAALTALLIETSVQHHEFERTKGHDDNWASWYARYMIARLGDIGFASFV
jgi:hypothetical protein